MKLCRYLLILLVVVFMNFQGAYIGFAGTDKSQSFEPETFINNIAGQKVFGSFVEAEKKLRNMGYKGLRLMFLGAPLLLIGTFLIGVISFVIGLVFDLTNFVRPGITGAIGSVIGIWGISFLANKIVS